MKIYPESTISVEVPNGSVPNGKIRVSVRADWTIGSSSKDGDNALLVAIEAKKQSAFGLGYLAVLRENRRKAGEANIVAQGFYSDGLHYEFRCIKEDGTVLRSSTFNIIDETGLKMVFSFTGAMLETAMKSTPTATPTKPGELQDKEVHSFEGEVWAKIYRRMNASILEDDDEDDMTDVIDLSQISLSKRRNLLKLCLNKTRLIKKLET